MFGLVKLPTSDQRLVVQTWRLVEPPTLGTRSLEFVGQVAYMVSRATDPDGKKFGGTDGLELTRRTETEWFSAANGIVWRIQPNGELVATKEDEVVLRGQPHAELWV